MSGGVEAPLEIVGLVGSLRARSYNRMLFRAACELAPASLSVQEVEIGGLPLYNADLDTDDGRPDPVVRLRSAVASADGVLIVSPEYNHAVPGVLQNAIDWASRPGMRSPFRDRPVGFMGASGGLIGTARGQQHLKLVLMSMLALPMPHPGILVTRASTRFDETGVLVDEPSREMLADYMTAFDAWIRRVRISG